MNRDLFPKRVIRLVGEQQRQTAITLLNSLPIDSDRPLCITFAEEVKLRKLDQNALMWVSQLQDIETQAYIGGRTYSKTIWHEFFKKEYLPEQFDAELTKEGYVKYEVNPIGEFVLVASTKDLTVKGFAQYLTQIEAYGASLGVEFGVRH